MPEEDSSASSALLAKQLLTKFLAHVGASAFAPPGDVPPAKNVHIRPAAA